MADRAGSSPGYVHKLEADRVRSPSPRVLAGLASALGLAYGELMTAAGYDPSPKVMEPPGPVAAVNLLEEIRHDVKEIKTTIDAS